MPFLLNAVTGWHDPDAGAAHREWARTAIAAASDASTGRAYVNYLGDTDAARTSYGDETYARLVFAEERLRPDEHVPTEPEHRAALARLLTDHGPALRLSVTSTGSIAPANRSCAGSRAAQPQWAANRADEHPLA
jgi:hypothetical protein